MQRKAFLPTINLSGWQGQLLAVIAGGLLTLSLAPYNIWPAGMLSCGLLLLCLKDCSNKQAALRGWLFGLGLFGSGMSWVYVSIHNFGNASAALASFLTVLFVMGLALFWLINAYIFQRFISSKPLGQTLGFASLWVAGEWFRSWFLTGLPWLFLGYGHLDSALAGWAPVTGVYGISFIIALSAAVFIHAWQQRSWRSPLLIITIALWLIGPALKAISWTKASKHPEVKVAMVQANIGQNIKWNHDQFWPTLNLYNRMSQPLWATQDLIIWPESAVPGTYEKAQTFLDHMSKRASKHGSSLITGLPSVHHSPAGRVAHNSIRVFGNGQGEYHKQRLVPFGEYVPLEGLLRGLIDFFDLPMSAFSSGGSKQALLTAKGISLAPLICYEVVYPELARKQAKQADLLLTISNDAWFGDSIGPLQHLEMAQMRALETGRYLIRSTGGGVSAIVDERGHITVRGQQFSQEVITGIAQIREGSTPFLLLGSWPILSFSLGFCLWLALGRKNAH